MTEVAVQTNGYVGSQRPYDYNNSTKRILPQLYRRAEQAGIPLDDIEDVTNNAFLIFWQGERPADSAMGRGNFRKVVTPALYTALDTAIREYQQSRPREWGMNDFMRHNEPPDGDLASADPHTYAIMHLLGYDEVDNNRRTPSRFTRTVNPPAEREHDEELFELTHTLFRELMNAIFDLREIDWPSLQQRYRFNSKSGDFFEVLATRPLLAEQRIAEYVAFGIEGLSTEELLNQPMFYSALHHVLNSVEFEFGDIDTPTLEPMRRSRTPDDEIRSSNYATLRAQLTGSKPSQGDITSLLTDPKTREEVGTTNLARLWQLLPRHRRRNSKTPYE